VGEGVPDQLPCSKERLGSEEGVKPIDFELLPVFTELPVPPAIEKVLPEDDVAVATVVGEVSVEKDPAMGDKEGLTLPLAVCPLLPLPPTP